MHAPAGIGHDHQRADLLDGAAGRSRAPRVARAEWRRSYRAARNAGRSARDSVGRVDHLRGRIAEDGGVEIRISRAARGRDLREAVVDAVDTEQAELAAVIGIDQRPSARAPATQPRSACRSTPAGCRPQPGSVSELEVDELMEIPTSHLEQQCEQAKAEQAGEPRIRPAREHSHDVLARRQQEGEQRRNDQRPQMLSARERRRLEQAPRKHARPPPPIRREKSRRSASTNSTVSAQPSHDGKSGP